MDVLTPEQRRKNMQNIRSKHTKPELILASELKKRKIYFSQHSSKIFGKPDFIFRRKKVVVFVDSDFWHAHPKRFQLPKSNIEFWKNKIEGNVRRDKLVNKTLKKEGWKVIRIWEYDLRKNPEKYINKILKSLDIEL